MTIYAGDEIHGDDITSGPAASESYSVVVTVAVSFDVGHIEEVSIAEGDVRAAIESFGGRVMTAVVEDTTVADENGREVDWS